MTERKAYKKAYYLAHKAEIKAYNLAHKERNKVRRRANYLANVEKVKIQGKMYRLAHIKEEKARHKAYYQANIKKAKAWGKKYLQTHLKEYRGYSKKYRCKHPETQRALNRKRQALLRGNAHEPYTDTYVFERDGWMCGICGRKINKRLRHPNPLSPSIDHIVPLSKGGSDAPINVQAAHLRCNKIKKAQSGGQLRLIG